MEMSEQIKNIWSNHAPKVVVIAIVLVVGVVAVIFQGAATSHVEEKIKEMNEASGGELLRNFLTRIPGNSFPG